MAKKREAPTPAKVESELSAILQDKILLKRTETAIASSLTGFKQEMADRVIKDFSADMQKKLAAFDVVAKQAPTQIDSTVYVIEDKIIPSTKAVTLIEKKEEPEQKTTVEKKTIVAETAEPLPMRASPNTVARDEAADNAREIVETKRNETLDTMSENIKVLTEKLAGMKKGVEEEIQKFDSIDWSSAMLLAAAGLDEAARKFLEVVLGAKKGFMALARVIKAGVIPFLKTKLVSMVDNLLAPLRNFKLPNFESWSAKIFDKMGEMGKNISAGAKASVDALKTFLNSKFASVEKILSAVMKVPLSIFKTLGQIAGPLQALFAVLDGWLATKDKDAVVENKMGRAVLGALTGSSSTGKSQLSDMFGVEQGTEEDKNLARLGAMGRGAAIGSMAGLPGTIIGGGIGLGTELAKETLETGQPNLKWERQQDKNDVLVRRLGELRVELKRRQQTDENITDEAIELIVKEREIELKDLFTKHISSLSEQEKKDATVLKDDMTLVIKKFTPDWNKIWEKFTDIEDELDDTQTLRERIENLERDRHERKTEQRKIEEEKASPTVKTPISQRVELDDKSLAALSQPIVREENTTNKTVQIINTTVIKQEAPDLTKFTGAIANLTRATRESGKLRESLALG